jgi:hypothetical protein
MRQHKTHHEDMSGIDYTVDIRNDADRYVLADIVIEAKIEKCTGLAPGFLGRGSCRITNEKEFRLTVLLKPENSQQIGGFIHMLESGNDIILRDKLSAIGTATLSEPISIPPEFNDEIAAMLDYSFDATFSDGLIDSIRQANLFNGDLLINKIEAARLFYIE